MTALTHRNTARFGGAPAYGSGRLKGWKRPCLLLLQTFTVPMCRGPRPGDCGGGSRAHDPGPAAHYGRSGVCPSAGLYRGAGIPLSPRGPQRMFPGRAAGQVKTKRYALSRLRRMALCAWLGVEAGDAVQMPQYLRLLGCTERGARSIGADAQDCAAAGAGEECRCALPRRMRSGSFCWKRARWGALWAAVSGSFQRKTRRRMAHRAGSGESAVKKKILRFKVGDFREL